MAIAGKIIKKVRGDIRREQIVKAVLRIIGTRGMSSLTTAAIAREVGMSEANLYRHVKNKQEIYFSCFEFVRNRIRENMEVAAAGSSSPIEMLRHFFLLQVTLMEQNRGIPRFLFSDELHVQKKLRETIIKTMHGFSLRLASFIQEGQRGNSIRSDLDPRTTALMFIGLVQGLTFRWSLSDFSFSLTREGKKLWKNFETCIVQSAR
jgi:AcrR family transcriptional regulator